MKATGDSIVLIPIKMEKTTESGIQVVQERKRHDAQISVGKIFDIGPLAFHDEMLFEKDFNRTVPLPQPGDFVLTAKYAGYEVKVNDDVYRIVMPGDINALLTEDEVRALTTWKP